MQVCTLSPVLSLQSSAQPPILAEEAWGVVYLKEGKQKKEAREPEKDGEACFAAPVTGSPGL